MRKAAFIFTLLFVIISFAAACGQVTEGPTPGSELPKENQVVQPVKVGLVLPGPGQVEDFIVNQALTVFKDVRETLWIDSKVLRRGELLNDTESLRFLGENQYNYVIAFGSMAKVLKDVAPEYPDTHFIVLDGVAEGDNITSLTFKEEEGAFLAGSLAALLTKTGKVGLVSTREPGTEVYVNGYGAGVRYVASVEKKPVTWQLAYTPSEISAVEQVVYAELYSDWLYDQQADIILPVPQKISQGVFLSAAKKGKFALGIDENQNWQQPGNIYASIEKRIDQALYGLLSEAVEKGLKPGVRVLGVAEGALALTNLTSGPVAVPPEVINKMNEIRVRLSKGEIKAQ